jgi:hypothetical protein
VAVVKSGVGYKQSSNVYVCIVVSGRAVVAVVKSGVGYRQSGNAVGFYVCIAVLVSAVVVVVKSGVGGAPNARVSRIFFVCFDIQFRKTKHFSKKFFSFVVVGGSYCYKQ